AVQIARTPTSFSTSAVSIITIASHGQPSRKHPSGPLLMHFLQPMQSMGSTAIRPNGVASSSGTQNMQSSTGQYSTHAGDPAQPVQHSVITASSLGFFLRGVVSPLDLGSCFSSSGTIPADLTASGSLAMARNYFLRPMNLEHLYLQRVQPDPVVRRPQQLNLPSRNSQAREALPDACLIVVLFGRRTHKFIVDRRRYVEEIIHAAIRELNLEGPKSLRLFMISNLGYAY